MKKLKHNKLAYLNSLFTIAQILGLTFFMPVFFLKFVHSHELSSLWGFVCCTIMSIFTSYVFYISRNNDKLFARLENFFDTRHINEESGLLIKVSLLFSIGIYFGLGIVYAITKGLSV